MENLGRNFSGCINALRMKNFFCRSINQKSNGEKKERWEEGEKEKIKRGKGT